jgi:allophanate hydrolase subunit 2
LPGPQADWFALSDFFGQSFTVEAASNRMGLRLQGEPLQRKPGELVSEPVGPGAVQVVNDGQCIVLGVDGQTIGGYPKVAHVIAADLDRLGQLRPGQEVRFEMVGIEEANQAYRGRQARLREWLVRLE